MAKNTGALALTWANKNLRLLSHENGTYEWVDPSDFRVSEVRLLHNVMSIGEVYADRSRAKDNLLIRGESLHALTSLLRVPEFAAEYEGKVKLVYIDPPFNTGQAFSHYDDGLEHSVWLTMLRDRLLKIRELLSNDGSVWVHLDDYEAHRARCVLDEIFGSGNFVATIAWEKAPGAKGDTDIAGSQDYIHVYAKNKAGWKDVRNLLPRTEKQLARYTNPDDDPRGPWRQGADGTAKSGSEENRWPITTPSGRVVRPAQGRYWAFSRGTFDKALEENRVYFGKNGDGLPIIKTFLTNAKEGVVPRSWWPSGEVGSNQEAKRDHLNKMFPDVVPFDTPKPERLMERIISIATNPGDVVLDCFAGSGTTAAVAQKLGRRWVTIEWSADNVAKFTLPRLTKVIDGNDPGGITLNEVEELVGDLPAGLEAQEVKEAVKVIETLLEYGTFGNVESLTPKMVKALTKAAKAAAKTSKTVEVRWAGGGGFRLLDVAPSVYEVDGTTVLLSDTVTAGELAESVAAQLGFDYDPNGVFIGSKGRMRLAVIDGVLNEDIVRILVGALAEKERVTVVATAAEPGAEDLLRNLRQGSRVRKVPRDLARLSARRSEVVQLVLAGLGDSE